MTEPVTDAPARRVTWLPGDTPHDQALDLWGYPPRVPKRCEGCGDTAEPFINAFCWRCVYGGVPYPRGLYVPYGTHLKIAAGY